MSHVFVESLENRRLMSAGGAPDFRKGVLIITPPDGHGSSHEVELSHQVAGHGVSSAAGANSVITWIPTATE
jgi:hypothetical protein